MYNQAGTVSYIYYFEKGTGQGLPPPPHPASKVVSICVSWRCVCPATRQERERAGAQVCILSGHSQQGYSMSILKGELQNVSVLSHLNKKTQ
jgi:hypothetical protein